ncbi:MAG TPA: hypothetical protein VFR64_21625, partial [Methylomirabilota bacterium]|nr:hypothetical protein [Methylomirabilota bacterium]
AFVLEDEPGVPAASVFFTAGQRTSTQCWMAVSFRSFARLAGRWSVQSAHTGEAEHPDRPIVNAPIGDRDRSGATLAGRSAVELALLSP